jgi:hypothetical protein
MDQDQRYFDQSCQELTEQYWRDWDHKTRYEWKLSFGYWAALLAMTAVVLKERIEVPVWLLVSFCGIALILHINFLRWIQVNLRKNRTEISLIQRKMREIARIESKEERSVNFHVKWWHQVSLWTQAGITMLLALLLVFSAIAVQLKFPVFSMQRGP